MVSWEGGETLDPSGESGSEDLFSSQLDTEIKTPDAEAAAAI